MLKPQDTKRIEWEEAVLRLIETSGICRSDAQSLIEAKEEKLESLYVAGTDPRIAAKHLLS